MWLFIASSWYLVCCCALVATARVGKTYQCSFSPDACIGSVHVKVGDRVVYSKYAGTEIEMEQAEHVLLKVIALLCVSLHISRAFAVNAAGERINFFLHVNPSCITNSELCGYSELSILPNRLEHKK